MLKPFIVVAGAAAGATGQVVDIDARRHCSGVGGGAMVALDAGSYRLVPIGPPEGQFTAWNAWGRVSGCDPSGAGCSQGWIHSYRAATDRILAAAWRGIYSTPQMALDAGAVARLKLCDGASVRFYLSDPSCGDNTGGVSLRIEPDDCPADVDLSGSLDFFDFLAFQNLFAAEKPLADMDCSGELDFFDFLAFQNLFAAGC